MRWLLLCIFLQLDARATGDAEVLRRLRGADGQLRPIITGCLDVCGVREQSCVTQCHVCVEERRCETVLKDCTGCLREARKNRNVFAAAGDAVTDSGGSSLLREGIRSRLAAARLQAIDGARNLRLARSMVLRAQRQSEWAAAEVREEIVRVKEARAGLVASEQKAKTWDTMNKGKLLKGQRKIDRLVKDAKRTRRQLARAKADLEERRKKVETAEDLAHAAADAQEVEVARRLVKRLEWKLKVTEEHRAQAEKDLEKQREDASWFHRGIHKEVRGVAEEVKREVEDLRDARDSENKSRTALRLAKRRYREAAAVSQNLTEEAMQLQRQLMKHELPKYQPASQTYDAMLHPGLL